MEFYEKILKLRSTVFYSERYILFKSRYIVRFKCILFIYRFRFTYKYN